VPTISLHPDQDGGHGARAPLPTLRDFVEVFDKIIRLMPGKAWQQTEELTEKFGLIGLRE
jgi:hypothetical protein